VIIFGRNHVSQPKMTSGVLDSTRFQNTLRFNLMLWKFMVRVFMLVPPSLLVVVEGNMFVMCARVC
jgi:hypothetical protein